jgi:hypothetical protein
MDTVRFAIEDYVDLGMGIRFPTINIYINNRNLIALVEQVERRRFAPGSEADLDSYAQSYIGFEPQRYHWFRREILGQTKLPHSVLLTCTCTIEMCNCIMADVAFDGDVVTWSGLHSPWRGGKTPSPFIDEEEAKILEWIPADYSSVGPYTFNRKQYLAALDDMTGECRKYSPWR